mmetsp:Transcript_32560/g.59704  ORF Transcript_32560/g.59704 Transcript_32560/m.59704 type:complete len:272 (-) Transcript_32560:249-1064(-)
MDNIRIVLVRTYVSGNIGSASRAMKNMALKHLTLVSPRSFPNEEATKMATRGAEDVLSASTVVDTLYDGVRDCELVIACTARSRSYDLPTLLPEQAAELLYSTANRNENTDNETQPYSPPASVALVFGPERSGLTTDDLKLAHYRVSIPANPENTSLNLASAVQILSYELRKCHEANNDNHLNQSENTHCDDNIAQQQQNQQRELPTIAQTEGFYETLGSVLEDAGVAHKDDPRQLMQKMRHLFARAEPDKVELNLLRGAFETIKRKLNSN